MRWKGLGFGGVQDVRAGKLIELELADGTSDDEIADDVPQAAGQHGDREFQDREARRHGMKSAVLVFPGSNCDRDLAVAIEQVTGRAPAMVWHRESELPEGTDLIAIPGGFSYGDYLRSGAMAARSPIMQAVADAAGKGVPVLGICNGFQVLTEAGPAARRADAQRRAAFRLPAGRPQGREQPVDLHQRLSGGRGDQHPRRPSRRQLPGRCRDARPARRRRPRRVPLYRRGQRLGAQHRRHPQRRRAMCSA